MDVLRTRFIVSLVEWREPLPTVPRRLIASFEIDGRTLRRAPHEAGAIAADARRTVAAHRRGDPHRITDALDAVPGGV